MAFNTIPLTEAEVWQQNWLTQTSEALDPMKLKSFLIPLADLQDIINEMGVAEARGVLGITPEGEYKLMLVAVNEEDHTLVNPLLGQYIYDFTTPCPPLCGSGALSSGKPLDVLK